MRKKKKRGLKRYYRNLKNPKPPSILDYENEQSWFDFYHIHIDSDGLGNSNWQARKAHLDALFLLASKIQTQLKELRKPYQFWLEIYEHDSREDALYIHTENHTNSSFPNFLDFDDDAHIGQPLLSYLSDKKYRIFKKKLLDYDEAGNPKNIVGLFLQLPGFGIPLSQ